eukprot:CAMPEP_0194494982 /NCGR_PEP_ID=MMETSP0253-20130528/12726_1 /TAXON_ID=2966 /ORGANISM="Noctiluca scintillans" /LENGTH=177 /DNA_ID=CAMNT_0039336173 /DNA_START=61 /DNA_END=591 /DNA_ORIENTATION=+
MDPARVLRLKTFFARASIATRLLKSRLAMPLTYPLNSSSLREGKLHAGSQMGWNKEDIERGLAHATPLVLGLARAAPVLKAAHALSHYNPGQRRHEVKDAPEPDIRLDFLRPQRLRGSGGGRGVGVITSKTPHAQWADNSSGRTVDAVNRRFIMDPKEDSPELAAARGKKFKSKTQW